MAEINRNNGVSFSGRRNKESGRELEKLNRVVFRLQSIARSDDLASSFSPPTRFMIEEDEKRR